MNRLEALKYLSDSKRPLLLFLKTNMRINNYNKAFIYNKNQLAIHNKGVYRSLIDNNTNPIESSTWIRII